MSLDLGNKTGRTAAFIDGNPGTDFSAIHAGMFTEGDLEDAGQFVLYFKNSNDVDITAGSADAIPTSMLLPNGEEAFEDGTKLTCIKSGGPNARLIFKDPKSGVVYKFLNRQGEAMSFIFDTSGGIRQWVAEV